MKFGAAFVLTSMIVAAHPAVADQVIYRYRVEHKTYGDIGTYTNIIQKKGDVTDVESELHVAVRILGIVMYRQDATRHEHWQGDRLMAFHGVTITDGKRLEVDGKAEGNRFAITTPKGTVMAPADVKPSNPWSAMVLKSDIMMSTRTGKLIPVRVSGGAIEKVTFDGVTLPLHQYEIHSDKREFVWLNDDGLPVAFETENHGTPVDFVLMREVAQNPSGAEAGQP